MPAEMSQTTSCSGYNSSKTGKGQEVVRAKTDTVTVKIRTLTI